MKLLAALATVVPATSAQDIGFEGPSFSGAGSTPTESKPESKLWFHDGVWWGSLWSSSARAFNIHRYEFATHTWSNTGVQIDTRPNSHGDAFSDGLQLYVLTHQFSTGGSSGNPIRLLRYDYDLDSNAYVTGEGFPVTVGDYSTEAASIVKDSTGTLWAAWTQQSRVRICHSLDSETEWSSPIVLPRNTTNLTSDDLCGMVHFDGDRIGVLWSDQNVNAYRFSFHVDGAADTAWSTVENATNGETDDHLNLAVHSDGRVFVAGKNEANNLLLLVRSTGGTWSRHVVTQPTPTLTRPIVLLNEQTGTIHVFATGQDTGEVFEKTSPLSNISFQAGTGTMRMRDASTPFRISNPTSTRQNVDGTTGTLVLAHHETTGNYWHHRVLPAPPVANFLVDRSTGQVPLTVAFTDSSTGNVVSRSWSFGDGSSSTVINPSHTYASVGTYSVSLTSTGPGGSDAETKTNLIVVLPPPPVANFSATPTGGLAPLAVAFTDSTTGSVTSRSWNFGDGGTSTATNPAHTYANAGTYTVSLTATGPGGADTETKTDLIVVQAPPPVASFGASPTSGSAPLAVAFTDTSTGTVTSWAWDFGDGATSSAQNPGHIFAEGSFTVSLTVTGPGGTDVETRPALIHVDAPSPVQTFFPIADARVSESSPSSNAGTATELRVRTDPGSSYQSYLRFDLTGLGGTVSSAKLRLFCTDEATVGGQLFPTSSSWSETAITWANRPAATGPQVASLGVVVLDEWVEVDVTAAVATGGPVSFLLSSTSSSSARYSSREGSEPPELVVETSPTEPPLVNFSGTPLSGPAPLEVTFADLSTGGPSSWAWSFGDGWTSSERAPTHMYMAPGAYTVTLVAWNSAGTSEVTKTKLVHVRPASPIQTLLPVADARVSQGSPSTNFGTETELRVRADYHSYVRFDLTGLSGTVRSATLRIFCTDEASVGGQVSPTSNSWTETGITWANKPPASGAQVASLNGEVVVGVWYELDVTPAIAAGGPISLLLTSTSTSGARYSSREGSNPPELVVEMLQPVPPTERSGRL